MGFFFIKKISGAKKKKSNHTSVMWRRRTAKLRFPPSLPFQLYRAYLPVCGFALWNGTGATAAAEATVSDNPVRWTRPSLPFACLSKRPPTEEGRAFRVQLIQKTFSRPQKFRLKQAVLLNLPLRTGGLNHFPIPVPMLAHLWADQGSSVK